MTREQAINSMISHGFKVEQVGEIIKAVTPQLSSELEKGTTKNNLGVDLISRKQAIEEADKLCLETGYDNEKVIEMLEDLPSVTPQEPQTFKWCETCKEYDQEKHCCHRWSKVIRNTVEEIKQEQEPILDKIKSDIAKFADTIPFVSGDIKAKYTNIGQHDGLEQALEIIEGNLKGDFDIDEWMAESE